VWCTARGSKMQTTEDAKRWRIHGKCLCPTVRLCCPNYGGVVSRSGGLPVTLIAHDWWCLMSSEMELNWLLNCPNTYLWGEACTGTCSDERDYQSQ
jgi:hypothetical protein